MGHRLLIKTILFEGLRRSLVEFGERDSDSEALSSDTLDLHELKVRSFGLSICLASAAVHMATDFLRLFYPLLFPRRAVALSL